MAANLKWSPDTDCRGSEVRLAPDIVERVEAWAQDFYKQTQCKLPFYVAVDRWIRELIKEAGQ